MSGGDKDKRLLILITGLELGGAERQVYRLAQGLIPRSWDVTVVSLVPINHYEEELRQAGADVRSLGIRPGRPDPRLLTRLWSVLRQVRPRVLLTFLFHANVLGRVVGRASGVPTIVSSIRNVRFGGRIGRPLIRLTDRLADATVANSRPTADVFVSEGLVHPERIRIVRNGIDVAAYERSPSRRAAARDAMGVAGHDFTWICVGRLEPQKNHAMLLEAFAEVHANQPRTRLVLAGDGSLRKDLEEQAQSLRLGEAVNFLGKRKDVPDLLAAADGMVLASNHEGLPNVVLEAMAARVPVVATAVGGVPEMIDDGRTGRMAAPGDADGLGEIMLNVMRTEASEVERMVEAAYVHVRRTYDLVAVTDAWESLLLDPAKRVGEERP